MYSCVILNVLLIVCVFTNIQAKSNEPEVTRLNGFNRHSRVYFGPRLGRLKRDAEVDDDSLNGEERYDNSILDMIQDAPWTVIALAGKSGKRHNMNFTPRLGRKSGEDTSFSEADIMEQRSPPFAPRLGRSRVRNWGRQQ